MNTLTYLYYSFLLLLFVMALTARVIFGNVETISWPLWAIVGLAYFFGIKTLWKIIQRKYFGESVVIDVTKFLAPSICPICLKPASEARSVFFSSTNAGPIPIQQHAELSLKLCAECAGDYDRKFFKGIKGVRIARVVYQNWTVQFKNSEYLQKLIETNSASVAAKRN
jgi:hypothetical protein